MRSPGYSPESSPNKKVKQESLAEEAADRSSLGEEHTLKQQRELQELNAQEEEMQQLLAEAIEKAKRRNAATHALLQGLEETQSKEEIDQQETTSPEEVATPGPKMHARSAMVNLTRRYNAKSDRACELTEDKETQALIEEESALIESMGCDTAWEEVRTFLSQKSNRLYEHSLNRKEDSVRKRWTGVLEAADALVVTAGEAWRRKITELRFTTLREYKQAVEIIAKSATAAGSSVGNASALVMEKIQRSTIAEMLRNHLISSNTRSPNLRHWPC